MMLPGFGMLPPLRQMREYQPCPYGIPDIPADVNRQYWWPPEAGYNPAKGLSGKYLPPEALGEIAIGLEKLGYPEAAIRGILRDNLLNLIARVWKA